MPTFPDHRIGIQAIWITATRDDRVLDRAALDVFVDALHASRPGIRAEACTRAGVPAIRIRGPRNEREAGWKALGEAFYAAGLKWLMTETDFDWLKERGMTGGQS
jgi:hypothetical protein